MTNIERIDNLLNLLKFHNGVVSINYLNDNYPEKIQVRSLDHLIYIGQKLVTDGYAHWRELRDDKRYIQISFDGYSALENTPKYFKGQPYKYKEFKTKIDTVWQVVKIIAVVLNSLAIIYLTYLSSKK